MVTGAGVAGTLSATVSLAASDAITLGGTFSLAVNTTSKAISDSLPVGAGTESLSLPVGPYLELTATNATLQVAGQTLSGDITIGQSRCRSSATRRFRPARARRTRPAPTSPRSRSPSPTAASPSATARRTSSS